MPGLTDTTNLIAMFPQPKAKQVVTPTLSRYIEDRLEELGHDRHWLADEIMDGNLIRLSRKINNPRTFLADELTALVEALQVKDWFAELVVEFGVGIDGCTVAEFDQLLSQDGHQLGRVNSAA